MWKSLSSTKIDGIKKNFSFGLDTVFESGAEMSSDDEISSFGSHEDDAYPLVCPLTKDDLKQIDEIEHEALLSKKLATENLIMF